MHYVSSFQGNGTRDTPAHIGHLSPLIFMEHEHVEYSRLKYT